jgi:hypothetical protein
MSTRPSRRTLPDSGIRKLGEDSEITAVSTASSAWPSAVLGAPLAGCLGAVVIAADATCATCSGVLSSPLTTNPAVAARVFAAADGAQETREEF